MKIPIETLIAQHGVKGTLTIVENVCYEKADNAVDKNPALAAEWQRVGEILGVVQEKMQ